MRSEPSLGARTGAFDVQTIVRASEHGYLDPLSGYLLEHVLGNIPEESLVLESTDQYPDVCEGDVRKQADWNLKACDLGQHAGVLN